MTGHAIRILSTDNILLDDETPEGIIGPATHSRTLRLLSDARCHIKISPDDSVPPVVASTDDFPIDEMADVTVVLAAGERVSIVRADADGSPCFISVSEVRRVLG